METNYYLMAILIIALGVGLIFLFRWYDKKYPQKEEVYQATLLFFDDGIWFCRIKYADNKETFNGFIAMSDEDHYVGEELTVKAEGKTIMSFYAPVKPCK